MTNREAYNFIPYESLAREAEDKAITTRVLLMRASRTGDFRFFDSVRRAIAEDDRTSAAVEVSDKLRKVEAD